MRTEQDDTIDDDDEFCCPPCSCGHAACDHLVRCESVSPSGLVCPCQKGRGEAWEYVLEQERLEAALEQGAMSEYSAPPGAVSSDEE